MVVDRGCREDVGDRQWTAICRYIRPIELWSAAEPALDGIVEELLSRPMFDRDAHAGEVRGQGDG
jgi:uncharacterized membrane protein